MIKHILIDILRENTLIEESITSKLSERCQQVFRGSIGDDAVMLYQCGKGAAYVQRRNNVLLLDLIDSEEVFEEMLEVFPREHLMIRLVERGIPED
jgi:hypothetical protein